MISADEEGLSRSERSLMMGADADDAVESEDDDPECHTLSLSLNTGN